MNWDCLIKVFEILSVILTVVCLNLVTKFHKTWLLYTFGCVLFVMVQIHARLYWLAGMGIFLMATGIRNYYIERSKKHE